MPLTFSPVRVGIRMKSTASPVLFREYWTSFPILQKSRLVPDQPQTAIVFKIEELPYQKQKVLSTESFNNTPLLNQLTLTQQLEQLLNSFCGDWGDPNMKNFANLSACSERTLRRRLAAEGRTFDDILSSWRLRNAVELMQQPSYSITEISQRLHYSNVNNFSRAFKRAFNCSPRQYRQLH